MILLKCICAHGMPCLESFNSSVPFLFKSGPNSHSWVKRPFSHLSASGLTIFPVSRTSSSPVHQPFILSLVRLARAPHQPCQHPNAPASSCWHFKLGPGCSLSWKALLTGPLLASLGTPIAFLQGGESPSGEECCLSYACLSVGPSLGPGS